MHDPEKKKNPQAAMFPLNPIICIMLKKDSPKNKIQKLNGISRPNLKRNFCEAKKII